MDIAIALEVLVPAAEYRGSLTDNTQEAFQALEWEDPRPQPTWNQIQAAWAGVESSISWQPIRQQRNRLIASTDWTQLADSPLTTEKKSEWAAYRQSLRDLTVNFQSPEDVVWPVQPI